MNAKADRIFKIDDWKIIEDEYRPECNQVSESVFSLANEYMGCSGTFEEGLRNNSLEGNYINGIFTKVKEQYVWKRKTFPEYGNYLLNTTNWQKIVVTVDNEQFSMSNSLFTDYCRILNMQDGTLARELIFAAKSGSRTKIRWERFISHADRHCAAIRLTVKPLNHGSTITIAFSLDKKNELKCFKNQKFTMQLATESHKNDLSMLVKVDSTGQYYIHRAHITARGLANYAEETLSNSASTSYTITYGSTKDVAVQFDKIISVFTSRDAGYPFGLIPKNADPQSFIIAPETENEITKYLKSQSLSHIKAIVDKGYDRLKSSQSNMIQKKWESADIEIQGDAASQQGIRFCMFQLFSTYAGNDSYLNIGAKGLTGEIYAGRAFWDTESYDLLYYLLTNPKAAKNLITFRYNTLEQARNRAREYGYKGAMYPWSTIDGTEDTAVWEYGMGEIHINAIMTWALHIYARVTDDFDYLYTKGIAVMIETARFWSDRVSYDAAKKQYCILRVTGPDEYQHWTNNNFYTNYMVQFCLRFTLDCIKNISTSANKSYMASLKELHVDSSEQQRWKEIADNLVLPYDKNYNVFMQDDLYAGLEYFPRERLIKEKDIPIERKWTIDKYWRRDIIKQPDVLLAMYLLRENFSKEQKYNNYKFYEQRCIHGSSLSPSVHSILANETGRYNQAYEYYLWASRLDLDNINNNSEEGLHISSMAGTWLTFIMGFAGLVIKENSLHFNPVIPDAWDSYLFTLNYKGRILKFKIDRQFIYYSLARGDELTVSVYEDEITVKHHEQKFPLDEAYLKRPRLQGVLFILSMSNAQLIEKLEDELTINKIHYKVIVDTATPPTSALFKNGCGAMDIPAGNCVLVSDNHDYIKFAARSGIKSLAIGHRNIIHESDITLCDIQYLDLRYLNTLF